MLLSIVVQVALADHPARLGNTVQPVSQEVHLAVDPGRPVYSGRTAITLSVPASTRSFTLHADELTLGAAVLRKGNRTRAVVATPLAHGLVKVDSERKIRRGTWTLELPFEGELRAEPYGLYRFQHDGRWYVVSQFEADDARTAWPCFDEPAFKIPLRLSVDVPAGLEAIGNSPVEADQTTNGLRSVTFATTPPIPMYGAALAVGPYVGTPVEGLAVPSTLWTVAGQEAFTGGVKKELPEVTRWLTDWFGSPMPYRKLDFVAVPEFAFGGMENPGAIVISAGYLADLEHQTDAQREVMMYVVTHEVAHMWFGDWVTLAWWDDLWLNESFADWIAVTAMNAIDPTLRGDMSEVAKAAEMIADDGKASVRPLRTEVDPTAVFETTNFAVYVKGRLVLDMVEGWLGPEVFQQGLRQYLTSRPFGTATAEDLFDALSAVSGKDVKGMMVPYLDTPGAPRIAFERLDDGRFRLSQRRYTVLGSTPDTGGPWIVPVRMRVGRPDGTSEIVTVVVDSPSVEADLGPVAWILPAADGVGYYTWSLPEDLRTSLVAASPALTPAERLRMVGALGLELGAGDVALADVLAAVPSFAGENDPRVVQAVLGLVNQVELAEHLGDPDLEARADTWRREQARRWLTPLGLEDVPGETADRAELRRRLLAVLSDAQDPAIREHGRAVGERFLADPSSIDHDLGAWGLQVLAEDTPTLQPRLVAMLEQAADPSIRQILLRAIGQVSGDAARDNARVLALEPALSVGETFALTQGITSTRTTEAERDESLTWVMASYDRIVPKVPPVFRPFIANAAAGCSVERLERAKAFFLDPSKTVPGTEQVLAEIEDGTRHCRLEVDTHGPSLAAFLLHGTTPGAAPATATTSGTTAP